MRALLASVEYADLLSLTLPWNKHHFEEMLVITTPDDHQTMAVCRQNDTPYYATNAFHEPPAVFNKWLATEEALDVMGRHGWLCILDADILWPRRLPEIKWKKGKLYTPHCRIVKELGREIPAETEWERYPLRRNRREWAGYTQIFHADDSHLGPPPWYQTNWKHAGGADSFFQKKWSWFNKVRPPFDVLHLGPNSQNWCGRVTPFLDGTLPAGGEERRKRLRTFKQVRRANGNYYHERYEQPPGRSQPAGRSTESTPATPPSNAPPVP